jgi:hypothetical protein
MQIDDVYPPAATFAKDDFQGVARLFLTRSAQELARKSTVIPQELLDQYLLADGTLDVDLLIQSVDFTYRDRSQIEPMLGDYFSMHFYGKSPMVLAIRGKLIDTPEYQGKKALAALYTRLFRMSQVAKHKVAPYLDFTGYFVQGAFLGMDIVETSQNDTVLDITAQFLVFNMQLKNQGNIRGVKSVDILYNQAGWVEHATN